MIKFLGKAFLHLGDTMIRTTLAIDDDVLAVVKEMAAMQRKSVGEVISSLLRAALPPTASTARTRNGVPLLPVRTNASRVTSRFVRQLSDELS
jgi:Ribbon-helix-helix protein, copG family